MSAGRWFGTTAVMGAVAWALSALGPELSDLRGALGDPQGLVDRAGADALVLVVVPVLAWTCWAWGAVGLLLTAASTVPGVAGRFATLVLAGVLPAGARRAAALALGVGLSATAPVVLLPVTAPTAVATAAAADDLDGEQGPVAIDWPGTPGAPDWPGAPAPHPGSSPPPDAADGSERGPGDHVVLRGDCLWDIAAGWLQHGGPGTPTDAEVQRAVQAWWQANASVIGPDPDLLLPGQVLRPPG